MRTPPTFQTVSFGPPGQRIDDLNTAIISNADGPDQALRDASATSECGCSDVYFRDLEGHLIRHIRDADFVMGCVAWLTSEPIITALAGVQYGCQIVVQKEDFLRPDGEVRGWKRQIRSWYERMHCGFDRYSMPTPVSSMSVCADPTVDPVRCVGNHNADRRPAFPRAHHKFVVFCKVETVPVYDEYDDAWRTELSWRPYAAWTGSFNFTANAGRSLENAIYTTSPDLVRAYVTEYAQVLALSEALDWSSRWIAPEWRIGT